jgi:hypothetical protein
MGDELRNGGGRAIRDTLIRHMRSGNIAAIAITTARASAPPRSHQLMTTHRRTHLPQPSIHAQQ